LRQADEHVEAASQRVARQRLIVDSLVLRGEDTGPARRLLGIVERSLRMNVEHRDRLREDLGVHA
jgi:hypothetical protein